MKKLTFLLFVALALLNGKAEAQNKVLFPDQTGEYLAGCFLNRTYLDTTLVHLSDYPFFNAGEMWPAMLELADEAGITAETASYYRTLYKFSTKYKDGVYSDPVYDLYIAFEMKDEIYAFNIETYVSDGRWYLRKLEPEIYEFKRDEEDMYTFSPLYNKEVIGHNPDYPYNKTYRSSIDLYSTVSTPDILPFTDVITKSIVNETLYGSSPVFLTEDEYMQTAGQKIMKMIERMMEKGEDLGGEKEKIMAIYNNPSILFETELTYHWQMIPKSMKEEFGEDIIGLSPYEIEFDFYNWDRAGELDYKTVTISAPFSRNNHKAGLYYSAILLCGDNSPGSQTVSSCMWKLNHIQGVMYGIHETAETMEVE